jgi:hypothetical protein
MTALGQERREPLRGIRDGVGRNDPDRVEAMPARRLGKRSFECLGAQKSRSA